MTCEELREEYEMYVLGLAEEPAASEIREHVARGCEVCTVGLKQARALTAVIGAAAPAAVPPARLRRRILASAGFENRGFGWAPWLAAATVLSLCAAVYFGGRQRQVAGDAQRLREELRSRTIEVTSLNEAFAILSGPDTTEVQFGQAPKGKVYVSPRRGVLLVASNLAPAPAGKTYEMWIIPKSGNPVAAGLFQSDTNGTAVHLDRGPVNLSTTRAIAVTIENQGGAAQPTVQPLLVAALP